MENTDLEERLTELDRLRTLLTNDKHVLTSLREEFDKMHDAKIQKVKEDTLAVSEAETEIRRLALEYFAKNSNKDIGFGVGIRVMNKIEYDYDTALAWGMEHSLALKVDDAAIKKLAALEDTTKNIKLGLDFVKFKDVPSATIPTDITKELVKAGGSVQGE